MPIGSMKSRHHLTIKNVSAIFLAICLVIAFFYPIQSIKAQATPDYTISDTGDGTGDSSVDTSQYQSLPEELPDIKEQVSTDVSPETPKPGDTVTITVATYGIDIDTQRITWTENGKVVQDDIGDKQFVFTMGNTGTPIKIEMTITPQAGPQIVKDFDFAPIDVDVLWQADTYTPPFYRGKALYTPEAHVTLVAIPNLLAGGKRLDSRDAVYTWSQDYEVQGDVSGFGKNTYSFDGPIIQDDTNIQAEVTSNQDSSIDGKSSVTLSPTSPEAVLYETHPLLGTLFNRELDGDYNLTDPEVKISAFPYYFSTQSQNALVNYNWNLNGNALSLSSNESSIIFSKKATDSGNSVISVSIGEDTKALQQSTAAFNLSYGQ